MKIRKLNSQCAIIGMSDDDLLSLRELIKSSCLPEKRNWQGILSQINEYADKTRKP